MKISMDLTAAGLVNALRWKRQDMLDMKRPKLVTRAMKPRGPGADAVSLLDLERMAPRRRSRLTKVQRNARMRAAERLKKAFQ
jgi:hypothetical protein